MKFGDFTAGVIVGITFTLIILGISVVNRSTYINVFDKSNQPVKAISKVESLVNQNKGSDTKSMKEMTLVSYQDKQKPNLVSKSNIVVVSNPSMDVANNPAQIRRRAETVSDTNANYAINRQTPLKKESNANEALLRDSRFKKLALAMNGTVPMGNNPNFFFFCLFAASYL